MLTVIGEALADLVDTGDHRTFSAHPGGSPLNVAVGLARLGHPTALLARFSTDTFGRLLRDHARVNGVDIRAAPEVVEPSTLAIASVDAQGRASYEFYLEGTADWQWTATELAAVPADTTILHAGSLASWRSPGAERIARRIQDAHADGRTLVSYDPNVRPQLLGDRRRGRARIERFVAAAHVVKASDEDLGWLYPDTDADRVAAAWLRLGPELVVVTRGPEGACAYRHGRPRIDQAAPQVTVVDTVGAGDALMSGLLSSLAGLGDAAHPAALPDLDDATVTEILARAILAAALTCERAGADPPTAEQLAQRAGAQ